MAYLRPVTAKREKLSDEAVLAFVAAHPGWSRQGDRLERTFAFADWAHAISFAVTVAVVAEKRDHHPELVVSWGKVTVAWWTHDRGGITGVDAEMAEATDLAFTGGAVRG